MSKFERISQVIINHRQAILKAWVGSVIQPKQLESEERESKDCAELLLHLEGCLLESGDDIYTTPTFKTFSEELKSFSRFRAISDFTPSQTANYILELKRIVTNHSLSHDVEISPHLLLEFNDFIDKVALMTFEFYVQTREELISSQAFALEHDTPIVKIKEGILLMPLMGIIDTVRAQKVIEKLLNAIVEKQAVIAILDMTAVPTFDTHVADNILKTVSAAKLVGAQVIISGISPNAAMTIAKLGINLNDISTFNTLESSIDFAYNKTHLNLVSA